MSATAAPAPLRYLTAHTYDLLDTIKVGARPWGIGISPDGKFLFQRMALRTMSRWSI